MPGHRASRTRRRVASRSIWWRQRAQHRDMSDNHTMAGVTISPVRRALTAPFTRRAWAELGYAVISFPVAVGAFVFSFITLHNGIFWAGSAPALRKLGGANRSLVHRMLGEEIPPPP